MSRKLNSAQIENLRGYIKVIEAFIQGKQLQYRPFDDAHWYDTNVPTFNFECGEYRIKPEVKELFYCIYKTPLGYFYSTNPVSKEQYNRFTEDIISADGVIVEERKITVTSEYENKKGTYAVY